MQALRSEAAWASGMDLLVSRRAHALRVLRLSACLHSWRDWAAAQVSSTGACPGACSTAPQRGVNPAAAGANMSQPCNYALVFAGQLAPGTGSAA